MKKSLYLIILLLSSVLPTQAQETLYFYNKNGDPVAFLIDEIDHIGFSKESDSEYNNQIVYLKDGTQYEVLTADVDSVTLNAPEPVMKKDAFVMDRHFSDYITKADTLHFTMVKNTPTSMLPKIGDVVASTYDNTAFPDGIMGKVISVSETDDGFIYECEKASIDDLYEEFYYYGYGQDTNEGARTRADGEIGFDLWNQRFDLTPPALILGDYTFTNEIHLSNKGRVKVLLRKEKGKMAYAKFELSCSQQGSLAQSVTGKGMLSDTSPLLPELTLPSIVVPAMPCIFFKPSLEIKLYYVVAADLKGTLKAHLNLENTFVVEMKDGQWSARQEKSAPDFGVDEFSLSIDGYIEGGLQPELFISLSGTKTGIKIKSRVGLRETATFKFDLAKYIEDASFYEGVKDSKIDVAIALQAWFNAQLGFLGPEIKSADIYFLNTTIPLPGSPGYFVPAFQDLTINENGGVYDVAVSLPKRELFFPVEFGLAAFDKANKLVEAQYLGSYNPWHITTEMPNTISTSFKLTAGKEYTFAPIVKVLGIEMRGNGLDLSGIVGTWYTWVSVWTEEMLKIDGYTRDQVDKSLEVYTFHDDGTYDWNNYYYPGIWQIPYSYPSREWYRTKHESGTYKMIGDTLTLTGNPGEWTSRITNSRVRILKDELWYGLFYENGQEWGWTLYRLKEENEENNPYAEEHKEIRKIMSSAIPKLQNSGRMK